MSVLPRRALAQHIPVGHNVRTGMGSNAVSAKVSFDADTLSCSLPGPLVVCDVFRGDADAPIRFDLTRVVFLRCNPLKAGSVLS
jgi:hypothetical protein